jgi:hypothetical protein
MLARLLDSAYGHAPSSLGHLQGNIMGTPNPPAHVFDTLAHAEQVIRSLADAGIDTKLVSLVILVSGTEDRAMGFHLAGDRIKAWSGAEAFWGGIWELLSTPAVFLLPGLGLVALAGPLVAVLLPVLEGAVVAGGISVLGAALMQIGVPRDQAINYETALKADHVLLLVHGTAQDEPQAGALALLPHRLSAPSTANRTPGHGRP